MIHINKNVFCQPFNPQKALIWKATFTLTALALGILAILDPLHLCLEQHLAICALSEFCTVAAVFCHFKAKKIGHENS